MMGMICMLQVGYFAHFTALGGAFIEACGKVGIKKSVDVNTSKGVIERRLSVDFC